MGNVNESKKRSTQTFKHQQDIDFLKASANETRDLFKSLTKGMKILGKDFRGSKRVELSEWLNANGELMDETNNTADEYRDYKPIIEKRLKTLSKKKLKKEGKQDIQDTKPTQMVDQYVGKDDMIGQLKQSKERVK